MTLYDTSAYYILSADLGPSLPDPAAVSGRTHALINIGAAAATWTSVGATPFMQFGVAMANAVVPRAAVLLLYSNGTHWVVTRIAIDRRIYSAKAVTNASGNATFTFTPAFAAAPVISTALETSNTNATEARVTALTAGSCTVQARQSPGVVILGISVLQVPSPLVGATVHLIAVDAGSI